MKKYYKTSFIIINLIIAIGFAYYTFYYLPDTMAILDRIEPDKLLPNWVKIFNLCCMYIMAEMIVYSGLALVFVIIVFIASTYKH